jgi:hypothetical protein
MKGNIMGKAIVRLDGDPRIEAELERIKRRRGMTQLSMMSRLVKWLARQDADTQRLILNGDGSEAAAPKLLKRWAAHANGSTKNKQ